MACAANASGRIEIMWLGTMCAVWSNQNRDSAVSTRPLCGIGVGMITSNAEMRSEATIRIVSP